MVLAILLIGLTLEETLHLYSLALLEEIEECHILRNVKRIATLYSDEWQGYKTVHKLYKHYIVDHGHGQYVNGNAYTNNIEGFWSILKRGLIGIYNHTSKKHLQRYVNEFCFRYNYRELDGKDRFNCLLCNSKHRITYNELTK